MGLPSSALVNPPPSAGPATNAVRTCTSVRTCARACARVRTRARSHGTARRRKPSVQQSSLRWEADGPTDRRTDGPTDGPADRRANEATDRRDGRARNLLSSRPPAGRSAVGDDGLRRPVRHLRACTCACVRACLHTVGRGPSRYGTCTCRHVRRHVCEHVRRHVCRHVRTRACGCVCRRALRVWYTPLESARRGRHHDILVMAT